MNTRTSAQRYNARMDRIFAKARQIEAERLARGESPNPNLTPCCRQCGNQVDPLTVFPGGICLACHEKKFNAELARTGILPRPSFIGAISKL